MFYKKVNIDVEKMQQAFENYVRRKAVEANSTIVYEENGLLIEEDPKTRKKIILQESPKTN